MPYPDELVVALMEKNGQSCGSLTQWVEYQQGSSPPSYINTDGSGDFLDTELWRVDKGGGVVTWQLYLCRIGTCAGSYLFERATPADDPRGNYCAMLGGEMNCSFAKARVENN